MQLLRLWSCCAPPAVAAEPERTSVLSERPKQLQQGASDPHSRQPSALNAGSAAPLGHGILPPLTTLAGDSRRPCHQDSLERKPALPATVAVFTASNSPSNTDNQPEPDNHAPLPSTAGSSTVADAVQVAPAAAPDTTVRQLPPQCSHSAGATLIHPHHQQQQQQQQQRPRRTISWQQEQQLLATSAPTPGLLRCMSAESLTFRGPSLVAGMGPAAAAATGALHLAGCSSHSLAVAPSECTVSALMVAGSGGLEGGLPRSSSSPVRCTADRGLVGEVLEAAPTSQQAAIMATATTAAVCRPDAGACKAASMAAATQALHLLPTTPEVQHPAVAAGGLGCSALRLSITRTSSSGSLEGSADVAVLAELGHSPTASYAATSTAAPPLAAAGTEAAAVATGASLEPGALAAAAAAPPDQTIARRVSPFASAVEAAVAALAVPGEPSMPFTPSSPHIVQGASPSPAAAAAALLVGAPAAAGPAHGDSQQGAAAAIASQPACQRVHPVAWAQQMAGGGSTPSYASHLSGGPWLGFRPPGASLGPSSHGGSAAGAGSVAHTPTSQQPDNLTAAAGGGAGAMEAGQVFDVLQAHEVVDEADAEEPHVILKPVRSAPSLRGGRLSFSSTASSTWGNRLLPSQLPPPAAGLGSPRVTRQVRHSHSSSSRGRGSEACRVSFQVPEGDLRSSLHIDVSASKGPLGGSSSSLQAPRLHTAYSAPTGATAAGSSSGSRSIKGLASVFSFGRRHSHRQHQRQEGAAAACDGTDLAPGDTSGSSNLASAGLSGHASTSAASSKPPLQPSHSSGDLLASPVTRSLSLRSNGSSGSLLLVAHHRSVTSSVTGGTSSGWSTSASSSSSPCNQPAVTNSSSSASLMSLDAQPLAPPTPDVTRPGAPAAMVQPPAAGVAAHPSRGPAGATAAAQETAGKFAASFLAALAAGDTRWASAPAVAALFEETARMVGLDKQLYIGKTAILRRLNAGMEQLVKMASSYQTDTPAAAAAAASSSHGVGDTSGTASSGRQTPSAITSVTSPDPVKRPGYTVVTYTFKWGLRRFLFRDEFVVKQGCIVRLRRSRG